MLVAAADPLRWWGAGLATLSALSYCNWREENIQILLKNPQFFPGFYCTSEILQERRKKKKLNWKEGTLVNWKTSFKSLLLLNNYYILNGCFQDLWEEVVFSAMNIFLGGWHGIFIAACLHWNRCEAVLTSSKRSLWSAYISLKVISGRKISG